MKHHPIHPVVALLSPPMKCVHILTATILCLTTIACGLVPPPEMSGTLEVVVTDQDEQPVAGAAVAVWYSDGRKRTGTTGSDGTYVQQHLVRGSYRVEVAGQSESCYVEEREKTRCPFVIDR